MSLSGVGFASIESAIASSYASYAARDNAGTTVAATTSSIQVTSTTNVFIVAQPQQVTQTLFASGIAELLQNLTAGNLTESKKTLSTLQASLGNQPDQVLEAQVLDGPNLGGVGLGGVAVSSVSGLFSQLTSGNSAQALDKVHNFLLGSGAVRGNTFDATV